MGEAAKDIKDAALRLLARREHSRKELLNKLTLKGYGKDAVMAVLDELARQGWQDDQRYAQSYARCRIQKGYGPVRIDYELRQNGIESVNLDEIVQQVAGSSWMDVLERVYSRKFKPDRAIDRHEWAKRSRFLVQRGFSGEMISALLDHLNISLNKF